MDERPMNATVIGVQGLSGSYGYPSELTYTIALHGELGDIIYNNVFPFGRPPYADIMLHPAVVGSPAFVSWDRDIARFWVPGEFPVVAQCTDPPKRQP